MCTCTLTAQTLNQKQDNDSLKDNTTVKNYLHEEALVKEAPSGIEYKNGNEKKVTPIDKMANI